MTMKLNTTISKVSNHGTPTRIFASDLNYDEVEFSLYDQDTGEDISD